MPHLRNAIRKLLDQPNLGSLNEASSIVALGQLSDSVGNAPHDPAYQRERQPERAPPRAPCNRAAVYFAQQQLVLGPPQTTANPSATWESACRGDSLCSHGVRPCGGAASLMCLGAARHFDRPSDSPQKLKKQGKWF